MTRIAVIVVKRGIALLPPLPQMLFLWCGVRIASIIGKEIRAMSMTMTLATFSIMLTEVTGRLAKKISAPTENGRTVTAMADVYYDYVTVYYADLSEILRDINDCKDKIIAVTQDGCSFTIFYERRGNEKRGDGNG